MSNPEKKTIELATKAGLLEIGADLWGGSFKGALTTYALQDFQKAVLDEVFLVVAKLYRETELGKATILIELNERIAEHFAGIEASEDEIADATKEQPR